MTTTSQPVAPPVISLDSTGVVVLSPPPDATDIVDVGQDAFLKLELKIVGIPAVVGMYKAQPVTIKHYVTQLETNDPAKTLGPFAFVTPATVAALNAGFEFTTGPFTTGVFPSPGKTFTTAAGDNDGVYSVVTVLHFDADPSNSVINDRILAVVNP
jgi:hypothetical protein